MTTEQDIVVTELTEQKTNAETAVKTAEESLLPWYALYLFGTRQKPVAAYLQNFGVECFYPQQYVYMEKDGQKHRELRPVVSNLIFVQTLQENDKLVKALEEADFKHFVFRKTDNKQEYYEIPNREMVDFKRMCNPEIELRKYISAEEAQLKTGTEVYVKYGPLKGLTGKLVRTNKKYYLLKELPGIGIQLKVARWCCVPLDKR